jgi:quercetin dioxygenase-like cupin family protein
MPDDKLIGVSIAAAAAPTSATQVQGGIKRTLLHNVDFPDGYVFNASIIEVQAGTAADRHTHPGIEIGYILDGEADLYIEREGGSMKERKPTQHLKPGASYLIPADFVHYAKVYKDKPLKVLSIFVNDKTRPLATVEGPAP